MDIDAIEVRPGGEGDLQAISQIQAASPEASQWEPRDYLSYELTIALYGGNVGGFAVARRVAEGETELLNLAVAPEFRRLGIASRLIGAITSEHPGELWLEVRESNTAARKLYEKLGFIESGRRPHYYSRSHEGAIVMKVHS